MHDLTSVQICQYEQFLNESRKYRSLKNRHFLTDYSTVLFPGFRFKSGQLLQQGPPLPGDANSISCS